MSSDPKLRIGDEEFELPSMSSLTMGEAVVINLCTGMGLQAFWDAPVEAKFAGLIGVALLRAKPHLSLPVVAEMVRGMDLSGWDVVVGAEVADPVPPPQENAGTNEPTESLVSASESGEAPV